MERRVAVTGLGIISPVGNDVQTYWDSLVSGKCGIDVIRSFPLDDLPVKVAGEVKDFEPRLALDGGEDGLDFYRRIAENANKNLARGGMLIMEVGEGEAEEVIKLFKYCDYSMIIKDGYGVDRFVKIVIQ